VTTATSELSVFVERKPGWIVEFTVEAPPEELDRALEVAGRKLGARLRIPGFRPGKARRAGRACRGLGGSAQRRGRGAHPAALRSCHRSGGPRPGRRPLGHPRDGRARPAREVHGRGHRPPVVDLADYRTLRIDRPHTEIGDSDVDSALEEVRRRFSDLAEVSRPAQAGDVLRCTLVMRRGEEVLSGGEERDLELDRERLVPGLVDALLGLTPGEERSFPSLFPPITRRRSCGGDG